MSRTFTSSLFSNATVYIEKQDELELKSFIVTTHIFTKFLYTLPINADNPFRKQRDWD